MYNLFSCQRSVRSWITVSPQLVWLFKHDGLGTVFGHSTGHSHQQTCVFANRTSYIVGNVRGSLVGTICRLHYLIGCREVGLLRFDWWKTNFWFVKKPYESRWRWKQNFTIIILVGWNATIWLAKLQISSLLVNRTVPLVLFWVRPPGILVWFGSKFTIYFSIAWIYVLMASDNLPASSFVGIQ